MDIHIGSYQKCDRCIQGDRLVPGATHGTQQTAPQTLKNYKVLIQITNTTRNANYNPNPNTKP